MRRHLYNKTGATKYQEAAFTFAEGNKSIVLLESLRENLAKGYGGVPDSLIIKEKKLTLYINFYKKSLAEEQAKNKFDESKISQYKNQLFSLENQYESLVHKYRTGLSQILSIKI